MKPIKEPIPQALDGKTVRRALLFSFALAIGIAARADAEPYAATLEALRSEITAKLPPIEDAARQSIVGAKDAKARVGAVRKITVLDTFLASNELDAKLAKFFVLNDATPAGLAGFSGQGAPQRQLIDDLLADDALILQIAIADGARPVQAKNSKSPAGYGKAMKIYRAIQQTSPKAKTGVLQRLALAVALEFSEIVDPSEEVIGVGCRILTFLLSPPLSPCWKQEMGRPVLVLS